MSLFSEGKKREEVRLKKGFGSGGGCYGVDTAFTTSDITPVMLSLHGSRIQRIDYKEEFMAEKEPDMGKALRSVGLMMKKLLDADTQKLVKVGFINGDLELTESGMRALTAVLFDANKAALVVEADAIIAEEEAKNK